MLRSGTLVDVTVIDAPSLTKSKAGGSLGRQRLRQRGAGDGVLRSRQVLGSHAQDAKRGNSLHPLDEGFNRIMAKVRARVEHPFRVIKRQFGYLKTRHRGLVKNRAQFFTLFALGNLFLTRRKLLA